MQIIVNVFGACWQNHSVTYISMDSFMLTQRKMKVEKVVFQEFSIKNAFRILTNLCVNQKIYKWYLRCKRIVNMEFLAKFPKLPEILLEDLLIIIVCITSMHHMVRSTIAIGLSSSNYICYTPHIAHMNYLATCTLVLYKFHIIELFKSWFFSFQITLKI